MMNKFDKSVISFISSTTDFSDVDLRVEEHHGDKYMIVYVDVPKVDNNSPQYDEQYDDKVTESKRRKSHPIPGLISSTSAINTRLTQAKKFFGEESIKYIPAFLPKNHKYLKDNEKEIDDAAKKIDPRIDAVVGWDSDYPKPTLTFYCNGMSNYSDIKKKYFTGGKFAEVIQELLGDKIKLSSYAWSISSNYTKRD
jgi:hypothetical protein